jgi:hypothetical protein
MAKNNISSFDKKNLQLIRQDLNSALAEICKKWGMNPTRVENITYSEKSFKTQLNFNLTREDFNLTVAAENPSIFVGRKFKMGSRTFTISQNALGKLIGTTNRGVRYILDPKQLISMKEIF